MTYDTESFIKELLSKIDEKLNTKIGAINSEKSDEITLKTVDSNAYFFQTLDGAHANFNPFVFAQISAFVIEEQGNYGFTSQRPIIDIAVVLDKHSGGDIDKNIAYRMLRYQRAIREVIEENFILKSNAQKLSVQNLIPIDLALINNSFSHVAIGVSISTEIG